MRFYFILLFIGLILTACDTNKPAGKKNEPKEKTTISAIPLKIKAIGSKNEVLKLDKIFLKDTGKPLPEKGLKPGKYTLCLRKKGYKLFEKEIDIPQDKEKFLLEAKLSLAERPVEIFFNIKPDKFSINGKIWTKKKGKLLPGTYTIAANKVGYEKVLRKIEVPVGEKSFNIMISLSAITPKEYEVQFKCNVKPEIP